MNHHVSEYGYTTKWGVKTDVEFLRVVGSFADRSDAEHAAAFFQRSQGGAATLAGLSNGTGYCYIAERSDGDSMVGASHAAVGDWLNGGLLDACPCGAICNLCASRKSLVA